LLEDQNMLREMVMLEESKVLINMEKLEESREESEELKVLIMEKLSEALIMEIAEHMRDMLERKDMDMVKLEELKVDIIIPNKHTLQMLEL